MAGAISRLFAACNAAVLREGELVALRYNTPITQVTGDLCKGRAWVIVSEAGGGARSLGISLMLDLLGHESARTHEHAPSGVSALWMARAAPERRVTAELLTALARVPTQRLARGDLSRDDWSRLTKAAGDLAKTPLWIVERQALVSGAPQAPDAVLWDVRAKDHDAITKAATDIPEYAAHIVMVEAEGRLDASLLERGDIRLLDIDALDWMRVDWLLTVSPCRAKGLEKGASLARFDVAITRPWMGQGQRVQVVLPNVELIGPVEDPVPF